MCRSDQKKKESHSTLPSYQVLAYFCSLSRIIPLYDRIRTIATLSRCRYSRYYHIIPYHIYLSAIYYLHHCLSVIAVIILSATAVAHCLIHCITLPTGIYLPMHLPTYIHTYIPNLKYGFLYSTYSLYYIHQAKRALSPQPRTIEPHRHLERLPAVTPATPQAQFLSDLRPKRDII